MAKAESFQGGAHFELLSATGTQSFVGWKVTQADFVTKEYDKAIKGYIYKCNGIKSKLQFPDDKSNVQLIQPFLVLQVFLEPGSPWSLEFHFRDSVRSDLLFESTFISRLVSAKRCHDGFAIFTEWVTAIGH